MSERYRQRAAEGLRREDARCSLLVSSFTQVREPPVNADSRGDDNFDVMGRR